MTGIHGVGVGLRTPHIQTILEQKPDVPWFELLTDNWLDASGIDGVLLNTVIQRYPVALHGVSMNLGGTQPLNYEYLKAVKHLAIRCKTNNVSDHLCFSAVEGKALHDLAPLPYTEEALDHTCERILEVQEFLGLPLVVENISAYLDYPHETLSEVEFINQLAQKTNCRLLLDINNLYVNQVNLGRPAEAYLKQINPNYVEEIHLGGHATYEDHLVDAHNNPVCEAVWKLYELSLHTVGPRPTLIEWDNDLPSFDVLLKDKQRADEYQLQVCGKTKTIKRASYAG